MIELVEFIEARLAEDEAAAQSVALNVTYVHDARSDNPRREAEHYIHHDPARVLREVAAKRAILGELDAAFRARKEHPDDLANAGRLLTMVRVLKLLASAWQDHPDYRTEWAPQ